MNVRQRRNKLEIVAEPARLQVEILKNLDQRELEPGNFKTILNATDESDRVDLRADILEEPANEA
jgi:hypothetical protein